MKTTCVIIALTALGLAGAGVIETSPTPPFPDGYRTWRHVSSGLIGPASPAHAAAGGLHSTYANALAIQGYGEGRFPDGAVLVYDLFQDVDQGGGVVAQGERRHVDVMVKDSKRFAATDGWGYAEFTAGERVPRPAIAAAQKTTCHSCHQSVQARDFVFSRLRD